MSKYPFYQIDAFTNVPFRGNPAAVMPLDSFLDDDLLQRIAAENNLSETAFIVRKADNRWHLRWFTPTVEVPLCGHATLAASHYLFEHSDFDGDTIYFDTKSGELITRCRPDARIEMDFPSNPAIQTPCPEGMAEALGATPKAVYSAGFMLSLFDSADQIYALKPNVRALAKLGVPHRIGDHICAAPGEGEYDVISRCFAPGSGIDEDPATGSAHCMIAPIFSGILSKPVLHCYQAYPGRGADIETEITGKRVLLRGQAVTLIEGIVEF